MLTSHYTNRSIRRSASNKTLRNRVSTLLIIWLSWTSATLCLAGNLFENVDTAGNDIDSAFSQNNDSLLKNDSHCAHELNYNLEQASVCCDGHDEYPAIAAHFEFETAIALEFKYCYQLISLNATPVLHLEYSYPPNPIYSLYLRGCSFLI